MTTRRTFLKYATGTAASAAFPGAIPRALAIPANHRTGTIEDVEHIIVLMQENRSFDHYFGRLRGVRGFSDPRAVRLPGGKSVWHQPNGDGEVLPFRPDAPDLGSQFVEDLPHGWNDTHRAWNHGVYDQWIPSKGTTSMAYLDRRDIPFHYALADAFTICDAYHCSLLGATDPNRYHLWTGWVGNDGLGGGPVVDNAEAGYGWSTFPEKLQQAGISWKIYQDAGVGLDAAGYWGYTDDAYIGNYGDNSLLYFKQYQNSQPGSPLYEGARRGTEIRRGGTLFDQFSADVASGNLPQVSWIVAPEAYTEHPNWPANYGAWYVGKMLDILVSNPAVFAKTAVFLTYDENDGFFDHMVPPTPPMNATQGASTVDTVNEIFPGKGGYGAGPYGLGVRVPMLVISPWSRGGWVNSQVFDHTSVIRFIEARFRREHPGLVETNITPWRRAVAGDLTSCFDFANPNIRRAHLLPVDRYQPTDAERHPDYSPAVPAHGTLPRQEPGLRPARALPYELEVTASTDTAGELRFDFTNTGSAAAVFQLRSALAGETPRSFTVAAHDALTARWPLKGRYDLAVHGPNGFLRAWRGQPPSPLKVQTRYRPSLKKLVLILGNTGPQALDVRIEDGYSRREQRLRLAPGETAESSFDLALTANWYDLSVTLPASPNFMQQLAGHLENGEDSVSDPAIGF